MITGDIFLFVPGKNWLYTSYTEDSIADLKSRAETFANTHGEGKWTDLRVYTIRPEVRASRGTVVWGN